MNKAFGFRLVTDSKGTLSAEEVVGDYYKDRLGNEYIIHKDDKGFYTCTELTTGLTCFGLLEGLKTVDELKIFIEKHAHMTLERIESDNTFIDIAKITINRAYREKF